MTHNPDKCPVCGGFAKGNKVCDGKGIWWSYCVSGKDHGVYSPDNGKTFHEWPEQLWFSHRGADTGKHGVVKITRQERTRG